MLKILGGLLVIGGCCLCGVRAADELTKQVRLLDELIGAVRILERELVLFRPTLWDLLGKMAQGRSGPVSAFLEKCRTELENSGCFAHVWAAEVERLGLPGRAKELLLDLGQVLGRYDDLGQARVAERIRAELEECALRTREQNRVRGKLFRTLGATAGGFLLLTLI